MEVVEIVSNATSMSHKALPLSPYDVYGILMSIIITHPEKRAKGRKLDEGQQTNYTAVMELYRRQCAERSEKTGVWGRIPQEVR
jgi:hypothetical protein